MTTDNEKTNLDGNGKNNTIIWSKFLIFILHVQAWRRAFHVCVCVQFPIADGYDERLHLSEFGLEKCMHPFDVHELTMSWTANSLWNLMQPDSQSSKFLNSLMLLEIFQIPGSTTMDQQQWTNNCGSTTMKLNKNPVISFYIMHLFYFSFLNILITYYQLFSRLSQLRWWARRHLETWQHNTTQHTLPQTHTDIHCAIGSRAALLNSRKVVGRYSVTFVTYNAMQNLRKSVTAGSRFPVSRKKLLSVEQLKFWFDYCSTEIISDWEVLPPLVCWKLRLNSILSYS